MKRITFTVLALLFLAFTAGASSSKDLMYGYAPDNSLDSAPVKTSGGADSISWVAATNAPNPINRAACGLIGNYIYVFGGIPTRTTAMAYNLTNNTWETSTPPPVTGDNWNGAVVNGELYLFPKSRGLSDVQKFTPTGGGPTGTWTTIGSYALAGASSFAVAWDGGNYIYCAGGGSPASQAAYKLDLTTNTYTSIAGLPEARGFVGGAFVDGKFYVVGGMNGSSQQSATCFEYNPPTDTWVVKASMPVGVAYTNHCITQSEYFIYIIGGGANISTWPATDAVQVYDPRTDTWTLETPRLHAWGTNSGCYIPASQSLFDGGGYESGSIYHQEAFVGQIIGGAAPDLVVTLTPLNPPIQIPASGGGFQFDASIENNASGALTFDAWTEVILPNGTVFGPLILRTNLPIAAGQTINRTGIVQNVPGGAPPGNYTYVGKVGVHPDSVTDDDSFQFTKLAGEGAPNHHQDWAVYGWFGDETTLSSVPTEYRLGDAYPNPFNPTTRIDFALKSTGKVHLTVFDVTGREVATLVNGEMPAGHHNLTFNGEGLASGVYFYKLTTQGFSDTKKMALVK